MVVLNYISIFAVPIKTNSINTLKRRLMKETLIRFLQMKECTYKIYLDYCKTMHKEVELKKFDELGIDSMFDTPFDAVKELYDNNITFDNTNYIYRDENNQICSCFYASEGIDMDAIAQWIIDGKCSSVTYYLLSLSNAIFDITDMTFPMLDDDFLAKFVEWLETEVGIEEFFKNEVCDLLQKYT